MQMLSDNQRVYKYEIRSCGYSADTIYARDPNEALLVYRNNCHGGEVSAGLDYFICRGCYDPIKGKDINFDAFEVIFARVDETCDGEPISLCGEEL